MKKRFFIFITILIFCTLICVIALTVPHKNGLDYSYNPEKAVEYSYAYVDSRNPSFANFESNCTNYISQCLVAGDMQMDELTKKNITKTKVIATTHKWFCYQFDIDPYKPIVYYMSSSFSRLNDFVTYWDKTVGIPYHTIKNTFENRHNLIDKISVGDILILHSSKESHCAIVVKIDENDIYYNSNTNDRIDYPLSSVDNEIYYEISYFNFVK